MKEIKSSAASDDFAEGMVRFTHALVEDSALRSWFTGLAQLPEARRRAEFRRMAEEMRAKQEDPGLVAAVGALTHPELFGAVRKALADRCGE